MNSQIIAVFLQEGGRFISELIRSRPRQRPISIEPPLSVEREEDQTLAEQTRESPEKTKQVATGCVPCAIGHVGTCSGLLAESLRFAREEGIESKEVITRINLCLDELNTMERVDLRPEKIADLPQWEKGLANKALNRSRSMRHALEELGTVDALERVAATTQGLRQELGQEWFQQRLATMPREEKAKLAEKAIERLEKE